MEKEIKEFKINSNLILRLDNNEKTIIFIKDKEFLICKGVSITLISSNQELIKN